MDPVSRSQLQSPFLPEVNAFTQSYQSPILTTFARASISTSNSIASQDRASHQIQSSSTQVVHQRVPSYDAGLGIAGFDLNRETSFSVAEPIGLGISFAPVASISQPHSSHQCSQIFAPSTPNNRRYDGEAAPATVCAISNINSGISPKFEERIDPSKLNSGFTHLKEQEKKFHVTDGRSVKKISFCAKDGSTPSTPMLPTTASFGPLLNHRNVQKKRTSFQASNNGQATFSNLSRESSASQSKNFVFTALNHRYLEFLQKNMEQVSPAMLNQVEIHVVGSPSSPTAHNQRVQRELGAIRVNKDKNQRLIAFSKEHCQSMKQSMTPEVRSMITIDPISQIGFPRPIIKLKVLPPQPNEFHLFTKLPTELQHRIWKFSVPGPRTVCLRAPQNRPGLEFFQPKSPPPAILQVCAQARVVALRILEPAFENNILLRGARTFFNFEIDTLHLTSGISIETAKAVARAKTPSIVHDRERVRHLEIPFHIGHNMRQYNSLATLIVLAPQRGWPALKTLTFPGCSTIYSKELPKTFRMPVIMVDKKIANVEGLMEIIREEFKVVREEVQSNTEMILDCGLKIVYLDEDTG
jgi:2EXR family